MIGLIVLSLGGLLLHTRLHPVTDNPSNFLPLISGILSLIVVPVLFLSKKTIGYGYTLNGFLVILGTIGMAHFSIIRWPVPATLSSIALKTTLPDIIVLWTKLFIGKAILELELFGYEGRNKLGKSYRYPNMGWWFIHLAAVSGVYTIGALVWR